MAIPTPGCNDGPNTLLAKILEGLAEMEGGLGGGDVVGPAGAVDGNIAIFDGITGKLIEDSGVSISSIITTSTFRSGSQAIGVGVDTISVVFVPALAGVPTAVVATISRPVADGIIEVNIDDASITAAGFTASLAGTTPTANYKLKWFAN